jgi:putative SOS response-associated peptidase YedK
MVLKGCSRSMNRHDTARQAALEPMRLATFNARAKTVAEKPSFRGAQRR